MINSNSNFKGYLINHIIKSKWYVCDISQSNKSVTVEFQVGNVHLVVEKRVDESLKSIIAGTANEKKDCPHKGKIINTKMHCIIRTSTLSVFFLIFSSLRAVVRMHVTCVYGVGCGWDSWWWRSVIVLMNIHMHIYRPCWHCINRAFRFPTNDTYLIPFSHCYFFLQIFCIQVLRVLLVDLNEIIWSTMMWTFRDNSCWWRHFLSHDFVGFRSL